MKEQLQKDMILAMKEKNSLKLETIRMVKSAIQLEEIEKKTSLSDDDIYGIISKQIKTRKESVAEFTKANRQDLIDKTEKEIAILMEYLPPQLTDEEINLIIEQAINKTEAHLPSDMGKVMKEISPIIKGKADMGKVSSIIKDKLNN